MLKENKWRIIISSLLILIPVVTGNIVIPLIMLFAHLICITFTLWDQRQKDQNKKALRVVYWILPFVSLLVNGMYYCVTTGKEINPMLFLPIVLGCMFVFIGNYLPKTKQNRTLGIKISWTLGNEENWNLTHRFGGKVWVVGGLVLLATVFLPDAYKIPVVFAVILLNVIIPVVYSYKIYKRHRQEGVVYDCGPKTQAEKTAVKISLILVPLILAGTAILMFTGDVEVILGGHSIELKASYWQDMEVSFDEITFMEYREDFEQGVRTFGVGSARLSVGAFQNTELGAYTRYAYAGNRDCVILTLTEGYPIVISAETDAQTRELYEELYYWRNKW